MAKTSKQKSKSITKPPAKKKAGNVKKTTSKKVFTATEKNISQAATMNVEFRNGLGEIDAEQFREGQPMQKHNIKLSSDVIFRDIKAGDTIAVNGACAGRAKITLNIPTDPVTPETFNNEPIFTIYLIL